VLGAASGCALACLAENFYTERLALRWSGQKQAPNAQCCRHCGHAIEARDRWPLLSAVRLRGRCRRCKKSIPAVYGWLAALALSLGAPLGLAAVWVGPAAFVAGLLIAVTLVLVSCLLAIRQEASRVREWKLCWPEAIRVESGVGWVRREARVVLWDIHASYWLEYRSKGQRVRRWGPFKSKAQALGIMCEHILPRPLRYTYRALSKEKALSNTARWGLRRSFVSPLPSSFLPTFLEFANAAHKSNLPRAVAESLTTLRHTTSTVLAERKGGR
jgi:hypothetical protein